ncbi:MAG: hypothetical protein IKP55_01020 [Clostridia bacterium]|nr:hypothetical protein [Clostridia bacterium]
MKNGLLCSPQKRVQLAQLWMQAFVISIWMISMSAGDRIVGTPEYYPLRRRNLSGSSARNRRTLTIRQNVAIVAVLWAMGFLVGLLFDLTGLSTVLF